MMKQPRKSNRSRDGNKMLRRKAGTQKVRIRNQTNNEKILKAEGEREKITVFDERIEEYERCLEDSNQQLDLSFSFFFISLLLKYKSDVSLIDTSMSSDMQTRRKERSVRPSLTFLLFQETPF